eukprot:1031749-Rhodomonas_salina.4
MGIGRAYKRQLLLTDLARKRTDLLIDQANFMRQLCPEGLGDRDKMAFLECMRSVAFSTQLSPYYCPSELIDYCPSELIESEGTVKVSSQVKDFPPVKEPRRGREETLEEFTVAEYMDRMGVQYNEDDLAAIEKIVEAKFREEYGCSPKRRKV